MKESNPASLKEFYGNAYFTMMRLFVDNLNEKQRRLFFGLEACRLGHGGRTLIVKEFSTSFSVIRQGEKELLNPGMLPEWQRVRHPGGGKKLIEDSQPEILEALEEIMKGHVAGDPMNADVRWTDLRTSQIREALEAKGFKISDQTLKRLLKKTTRSRNRSKRRR